MMIRKTLTQWATISALAFAASAPALAEVPRTAFVHLFEWKWDDVATECEQVLGPKGFSAVQVSPPQQSVDGHAWWTRYQPVSYQIEGRSGNREQFRSMVERCNNVGVGIYVDAVINHMAAWDRNFPGVPYGPNDFHNCTDNINYGDRWMVQNCDLVGLNDLATESDYVKQKIADYFNDLVGMGVKGFRIDAAKHMPAGDIGDIIRRVNGSPFIFQEVIGAPGEPVGPGEYLGNGSVTEFNFERTIGHHFKGRAPLKDLKGLKDWGWIPSDKAVVFVANHDDQRQNMNTTLHQYDAEGLYYIGHIFMLAYPYGYPKVMSSYHFDDHDQGPPGAGPHTGDSCNGGWLCEHSWRGIANMVGFRNHTADTWSINNWWDNGNNQIAFSRGDKGFVVINREEGGLSTTLQTGMAAGEYCDIINADFDANSATCDGPTISVGSDGKAFFDVGRFNASAIHVGAKVGNVTPGPTPPTPPGPTPPTPPSPGDLVPVTFSCSQGDTYWGQSVYVAGDVAELGDYKAANAIKLSPANYPTWTGTINVPANTDIDWQCIKRDETDPSAGVEWQGIGNKFNTGSQQQTQGSFGAQPPGPVPPTPPTPTPPGGNVDVTFTCSNGYTEMGQSVYVVGSSPDMGGWSPANAIKLNPKQYPVWSATISLPAEFDVEWKCIKRDENNPNNRLTWQDGDNNRYFHGDTSAAASF